MFIGAHFWVVPEGTAFTSPSAGTVAQNDGWPDEDEPLWPDWNVGIVANFEVDPKYGPREEILAPSPGAVQADNVVIPYAIPEVKFMLREVNALAIQLALNAQQLWANGAETFNPNGGGGPGMRCILKAQKYDHNNILVLNWSSWAFVQLQGALKGDPKQMTQPEFIGTLLYSDNNDGSI